MKYRLLGKSELRVFEACGMAVCATAWCSEGERFT